MAKFGLKMAKCVADLSVFWTRQNAHLFIHPTLIGCRPYIPRQILKVNSTDTYFGTRIVNNWRNWSLVSQYDLKQSCICFTMVFRNVAWFWNDIIILASADMNSDFEFLSYSFYPFIALFSRYFFWRPVCLYFCLALKSSTVCSAGFWNSRHFSCAF